MVIPGQIFFTNPALWTGLFALGVPVLIHILTRKTPRELVFPTLKFIQAAKASQSSIYRVRHILLLILRSLLILLILLAFLKPVMGISGGLSKQDSTRGKVTILLLDVSASMGYSPGGTSSFSRGIYAAEKILDHLDGGDKANLILMGATANASFDEPGKNIYILRKDLKSADITQERADINAAVAEAVRQFAFAGDVVKELHFISDFQRSNWSSVDFSVIPDDVKILFVPVSDDSVENCSITEVAIQPACPTVSEEVRIACKVANYGLRERNIKLEMVLQDGKILTEKLNPAAGFVATADFGIRPTQSGDYQCRMSIPADGLEIDDSRFFTFRVTDKIEVLVISDKDPSDETSGPRFLARAINPFIEQNYSSAVATRIRSSQIDKIKLAKAQVVVIDGINELSRKAAKQLIDHVKEGGSVIYFHAGRAAWHNLTTLAEQSDSDFVLPYNLISQIDLSQKGDFSSFANANFDHRILKKFKESPELGKFQFYRYYSTHRVKRKGQILLQYDDGNAAMALKSVGAGNFLLCNFSCSIKFSDIARHKLFVPLVHEIIRHMRPVSALCNSFEVGDQCSMTITGVDKKSKFEFKEPSGKTVNGNVEISNGEAAVFFPMAEKSGFYSIYVDDKGSAAVNVNALESNLEVLTEDQLQQLSQIPRAKFYASVATASTIDTILEGKNLWHYFLIGAICILAMEQIMVLVFKR
mgnify:CR=1 FL=1